MKIALLYAKEKIASTVYDHVKSFGQYSKNDFTNIDAYTQKISLEYADQFDAIIVHYSISLFNDDRCPAWLRTVLQHTKAKKIVFIQDEYRVVNDVVANLNFIKADLLYTCVPKEEIEKVYPKEKLPNLIKINTLTGFVPENLLKIPRRPYAERNLDVVYRARKLSAWYGMLAQEKWQIAEKFSKDASKYNLVTDVSYQENKRIYGNAWVEFLQNSKAALGCESGANVFDFTGEIQEKVEAYEKENPCASFEEIEQKFFSGLDGKIKMNQISPRCFECAALGTLMILYEGDYSGILKPWRHYVPLKKDHSNMKEVVDYVCSLEKWQEITDKAYHEVALNEAYSYKYFIKCFDEEVAMLHKGSKDLLAKEKGSVLNDDLIFEKIPEKKAKVSLKLILQKGISTVINLLDKSGSNIKPMLKRIILSTILFQHLLRKKDLNHLLLAFKKDFYYEYNLILLLERYVLSIKNSLGLIPIKIRLVNDSLLISVTPNVEKSERFSSFVQEISTIKISCEDTWGVSKEIRGIQHTLKYKSLAKKIMSLQNV